MQFTWQSTTDHPLNPKPSNNNNVQPESQLDEPEGNAGEASINAVSDNEAPDSQKKQTASFFGELKEKSQKIFADFARIFKNNTKPTQNDNADQEFPVFKIVQGEPY